VIGFIVAGLIIGALPRLVKPGKQNLSVIATLVLGLVGSVLGPQGGLWRGSWRLRGFTFHRRCHSEPVWHG
jgi:uncharacterized membrane protein YeaQ/YmgE (transglycosylase-associated protein family)